MLCRVVVNPTRSNVDYYLFFFIEHSNKCSTKVSENCQQGTRLILIKAFVRKHFVTCFNILGFLYNWVYRGSNLLIIPKYNKCGSI